MLVPALITGLIVTSIAAFAPRAPAAIMPPPPPPPTPPTPPIASPGMPGSGELPAGRTIRIDPDFPGARLRARVGDTIQMHGVSPRSQDNPGGYEFSVEPMVLQAPYTLVGLNEYRLVRPGSFTIRWAPNYEVTVEVES